MDLLPNNKLKKVALSDHELYRVVLFENELNKVVLSELEKVFTNDEVIDLTSDNNRALFTLPTRVSILLT